MKTIASRKELDRILSDCKPHEFRLYLAGGIIYSRKTIRRVAGMYHVTNHIDGTKQKLNAAQLFDSSITNIGKGILKGALVHML